jgi:hypothetical protein
MSIDLMRTISSGICTYTYVTTYIECEVVPFGEDNLISMKATSPYIHFSRSIDLPNSWSNAIAVKSRRGWSSVLPTTIMK